MRIAAATMPGTSSAKNRHRVSRYASRVFPLVLPARRSLRIMASDMPRVLAVSTSASVVLAYPSSSTRTQTGYAEEAAAKRTRAAKQTARADSFVPGTENRQWAGTRRTRLQTAGIRCTGRPAAIPLLFFFRTLSAASLPAGKRRRAEKSAEKKRQKRQSLSQPTVRISSINSFAVKVPPSPGSL